MYILYNSAVFFQPYLCTTLYKHALILRLEALFEIPLLYPEQIDANKD